MNPETERELEAKYPEFFRNRNRSPKESLMCFGCECGEGWKGILENLFGYLSVIRASRSFMLALKPEFADEVNGGFLDFVCPAVILDQVKEKYGTLRVYWHFPSEEVEQERGKVLDPEKFDQYLARYDNLVDDAVDFAEYLSSKTCEVTGKPGELYSEGWCVTLCEEEAAKRFGRAPDAKPVQVRNPT